MVTRQQDAEVIGFGLRVRFWSSGKESTIASLIDRHNTQLSIGWEAGCLDYIQKMRIWLHFVRFRITFHQRLIKFRRHSRGKRRLRHCKICFPPFESCHHIASEIENIKDSHHNMEDCHFVFIFVAIMRYISDNTVL